MNKWALTTSFIGMIFTGCVCSDAHQAERGRAIYGLAEGSANATATLLLTYAQAAKTPEQANLLMKAAINDRAKIDGLYRDYAVNDPGVATSQPFRLLDTAIMKVSEKAATTQPTTQP